MLSAPVNDMSNETTRGNASTVRQNPREVRPHHTRADGFLCQPGHAIPPEFQPSARTEFSRAQSTYGNQAVLRMLNYSGATPALQRKCPCEGSGEECGSCAEKKEGTLHRQAANHQEPSGIPPIVHEVLHSPGRPLDADTRAFMEPRFGYDFSGVRIHNDSKASDSARAVNALAYTVGNHIVMGGGQYSPEASSTRRLLAHELAHVVQQRGGATLQGFGISKPGDASEREADSAAEAVMSYGFVPGLTAATGELQRQACDPLLDPLCEEQKRKEAEKKAKEEEAKLDPKTRRVYQDCPEMCRKFPLVEIVPDVFIALCDDALTMGPPVIKPVGCTPGRPGILEFYSGSPAWQIPEKINIEIVRPWEPTDKKPEKKPEKPKKDEKCTQYTFCTSQEWEGKQPPKPDTSKIQIGYIQTVENCLSGGVYFKKDGGKWVWAGNRWSCVKNARDGLPGSTAPWYGLKNCFGPEKYPGCPAISDTPLIRLPTGQNMKCIDNLYNRPEWWLRRMRIDGIFHLWLIAKVGNGPPIYIHNWTIQDFVVTQLTDDGDPCNIGAWQGPWGKPTVTSSGPGRGSATPVLTGDIANNLQTNCSTPPSSDLKDEPCKGMTVEVEDDKKKTAPKQKPCGS
jgi:hypothetical protein